MGWVAGAVLGAGGLAAGLSSGGGGSKEPDKDTSSPILAITNNAPATINATTGSVLYTFTFNEAVTGFSAANVVVSNGLKGTFTALSSTVYTLQITPNGGTVGQLSVSVAAGAATDSSGNKSLAASSLVAIDTVPPVQTVTITSVNDDQPAITGVITSGGTTNDPTLSLAGQVSAALSPGESLAIYRDGVKVGVAAVNALGWTYTDTAVGVQGGHTYTARVEDAAGNKGVISAGYSVVLDSVSPAVSITTNDTVLKAGEVALLTFTLSEASTSFTDADVVVAGGTLSGFAGSGTSYTASFTPTTNS
ncbi:MAG: Ig-like domain-containing protein, partial [Rhodocyclales bacterium]|nr:Ig-like domain-containing protein [Rhodocyclales bacterium]